MTFDLTQLFLLGLLTSSAHWLIARSEIAKPIWSRTRGWLAKLLECAGCSGFWLGAIAGSFSFVVPVAFPHGPTWSGLIGTVLQTFVTAILGTVVTPVFEAVLLWGLRESAIVEEPPEPEGAVPVEPAQRVDSNAYVTPVSNPMRKAKL